MNPLSDNKGKSVKEILKKVRIKEIHDNATYTVEDVISFESLTMKIVGKMRMNYIRILVNDIVYMVLPNPSSKEGRLIDGKYICWNNMYSDLCQQKIKIEQLEKNRP